jgi:hypothetical protein
MDGHQGIKQKHVVFIKRQEMRVLDGRIASLFLQTSPKTDFLVSLYEGSFSGF